MCNQIPTPTKAKVFIKPCATVLMALVWHELLICATLLERRPQSVQRRSSHFVLFQSSSRQSQREAGGAAMGGGRGCELFQGFCRLPKASLRLQVPPLPPLSRSGALQTPHTLYRLLGLSSTGLVLRQTDLLSCRETQMHLRAIKLNTSGKISKD